MTVYPSRRVELEQLLKRTCQEKLIQANPTRVREMSEQAWRLAQDVGAPWKQLASYRLAHVLLREPCSEDDLAVEIDRLHHVAELFRSAATCDFDFLFGPLPHIYLMAVLHRLAKYDPANAETYRASRGEHFERAVTLTRQAGLRLRGGRPEGAQRIQNDAFNLLEFASYLIELDYSSLRGIGADLGNDLGSWLSGSWEIVSNNKNSFGSIKYSFEFGLAELEAINQRETGSVVFIYGADEAKNGWRCSGSEFNQDVNPDHLRLLSLILAEPRLAQNVSERENRFVTNDCRQLKRRCKEKLVSLVGVNSEYVFPGTTFDLKIPVYGLVQHRFLTGRR